MTYSYSSTLPNQLTTIAETGPLDKGFKKITAGATGYTYDNNGNVNADGYRGITGTSYNPLNLPSKVTYSATKYIEYTYDATGRKWKSKTVDGATTTEKTYLGSMEYLGSNLEAIYHAEGRAVPVGAVYEYEYAIRDHLGNTRVMFKVVSGTATLIQESHYYPFGMEMDGFQTGSNRYRYNGKELQLDLGLGMYDFGARWYDASIGRWNAVDPLAEGYQAWSPYNYTMGNPIKYIDLFGMMSYSYNWDNGTYEDEDGKEVSWNTVHASIQDESDINAYVVNNTSGRLSTKSLLKSFDYASDIYAKNGFDNVQYNLLSEEEAENFTPQWFDVFLRIKYSGDKTEGGYVASTSGIPSKSINRVNYNYFELENHPNKAYALGYLIAHETLHSIVHQTYYHYTGDYERYNTDAKTVHRNDTPNLLMDGGALYKNHGGIPKGPSAPGQLHPAERITFDHKFWIMVLSRRNR